MKTFKTKALMLMVTMIAAFILTTITTATTMTQAHAAEIYLHPRNASIPSGGATLLSVIGGFGGRYSVLEFASQNQCVYYNYKLPDEYVAAATINARITFAASSSTGTATLQASSVCIDHNEIKHGLSLTAGTASNQASGAVKKIVKWTPASNFINSSTCSPGDELTVKFCRTDVNAFAFWIRRPDLFF